MNVGAMLAVWILWDFFLERTGFPFQFYADEQEVQVWMLENGIWIQEKSLME